MEEIELDVVKILFLAPLCGPNRVEASAAIRKVTQALTADMIRSLFQQDAGGGRWRIESLKMYYRGRVCLRRVMMGRAQFRPSEEKQHPGTFLSSFTAH